MRHMLGITELYPSGVWDGLNSVADWTRWTAAEDKESGWEGLPSVNLGLADDHAREP